MVLEASSYGNEVRYLIGVLPQEALNGADLILGQSIPRKYPPAAKHTSGAVRTLLALFGLSALLQRVAHINRIRRVMVLLSERVPSRCHDGVRAP